MKRTLPVSDDVLLACRSQFRRQAVPNLIVTKIQRLVLSLIFGNLPYDERRFISDRPELPGPLPVTLSRKHVETITTHKYAVCEKSDGERCMMLLIQQPIDGIPAGTYLLDRSFTPQSIDRGLEYAAILASPRGPTLLEGELLLRSNDASTGTGAKAVYLMFDTISVAGVDYAGKPLSERLNAMYKHVRSPFSELDDKLFNNALEVVGKGPDGSKLDDSRLGLPLYLCRKVVFSSSQIRDVVSNITENHQASTRNGLVAPVESEIVAETGELTHRFYRSGKHACGTDGLIFTPASLTYRQLLEGPEAKVPLLKWKFLDENSVDFQIQQVDIEKALNSRMPSVEIPLYVANRGQQVCVTTIAMTQDEASAYLDLIDKLGLENLIVESVYNANESKWQIKKVRNQKTRPNAIRTAWGTLEAVMENVTLDELVTACTSRKP